MPLMNKGHDVDHGIEALVVVHHSIEASKLTRPTAWSVGHQVEDEECARLHQKLHGCSGERDALVHVKRVMCLADVLVEGLSAEATEDEPEFEGGQSAHAGRATRTNIGDVREEKEKYMGENKPGRQLQSVTEQRKTEVRNREQRTDNMHSPDAWLQNSCGVAAVNPSRDLCQR
ncbi:hypothetical protein B0H10DRAFT_1944696 [Mycena sp. CBHHK59/15]|nr:hypothetical protein B0H10DRAFT_1944696 [Mycena sp. CBHHK59/15]